MKPSYILKELKVPLIDLQTCSDYYQKANLHGIKPIISEEMICSKLPVGQMDQCIVRIHPVGTFQNSPLSDMPIPCLVSSESLSKSSSVWTGPNSTVLDSTIGRVTLFALCMA